MKHRWSIVTLAVLGAAAFALSVQALSWWYVGEVTIGPFGARHCFGGECRGTGLAWTGGDDLWMRSAVATRVAAIVTAFVLVMLGGAVAAGRVPRLLARVTVVSLATAVVCAAYFVARFPGLDGVHDGFGLPLYAVAIVLGAAAVIAVQRTRA